MKHIAIVGAGFCGLACAYYLSRSRSTQVTLYDPAEIGDNASGIAAGLLHTYAGAHARLIKGGIEGRKETLQLAEAASNALGKKVAVQTGLLRIAITDQQKQDFSACAEKHEDVEWLPAEKCRELAPGLVPEPGILIRTACVIKTEDYLKGLWQYCRERGAEWIPQKILSLDELREYDAVIVAAGAATPAIQGLGHLPIRPVKGQILKLRWPANTPVPCLPVNSRAYLIQEEGNSTCHAGATFERNFTSVEPDVKQALEYLRPRMMELYPELDAADILDCSSGLRASTPNHRPLVQPEGDNVWVIAGMGSKGLLFHATCAKRLVEQILITHLA